MISPNSFIHIIESPSPSDLLDGRTEGRVLKETLALAGIASTYNLAVTKEMFMRSIHERLLEAFTEKSKLPILHFSAHGNASGIVLTNEEFISWDQLRDILKPISAALGEDLLICMSSCHGAGACEMAMTEEIVQEFGIIIGHFGKPLWHDAAIAFATFYHQLFKNGDIEHALEAMKMASGDSGFTMISGADAKVGFLQRLNERLKEEIEKNRQEREELERSQAAAAAAAAEFQRAFEERIKRGDEALARTRKPPVKS